MTFEGGALGPIWKDAAVKKAAAGYVRLLVRVPEAYWLVTDYKVTRPGVLVLDPRGRKVAAQALSAREPTASMAATLAKALVSGATAKPAADALPPQVTLAFTAPRALPKKRSDKLLKLVRRLPGVSKAVVKGATLTVTTARLWADPGAIRTAAKLLDIQLAPDAHRRTTVEVTLVTNTPRALRIKRIRKQVEGVLVAAPDVARNRIEVLFRSDAIDLAGVRKAVTAVGYTLKERK